MESKSRSKVLIAACVALTGLLAIAPASKAADRITSQLNSKCTGKLNDSEWRALSLAAGRVLMHADRARNEIAEKKLDMAEEDVEKGMTLVNIIESAEPRYEVSATIRSGDLVYQDEDKTATAMVPIYDELDRVDLIGPVARAKQQTVTQDNTPGTESIVLASELEYTSMDLDVPIAESGLKLADEALKRHDTTTADTALRNVQRSVVFRYDEADLPLSQAADNLKIAEADFSRGENNAASVALSSASDALKRYEQTAGETRAAEARKLHQEIDALNKDLDKNASKASEMVPGWWDRVVAWFRK